MPRPRLHIDFETFSDVNLLTRGEEVYSRRAVPLMLAMGGEGIPVVVDDYAENFNAGIDDFGNFDALFAPDCPDLLAEAIKDDWWIVAHNWSFEAAIFRNSPALRHWPKPKIERWICTAAKARYWGLPSSLEKAGSWLKLDVQKDKQGAALIRKFCIPNKIGVKKGAPTAIRAIDPESDDWRAFKRYCRDDVKTEYGIDKALPDIPEGQARGFYVDARMNVRGVPVDLEAVATAKRFYAHFYGAMEARFKAVTKGLKPGQVAKVKELVNELCGEDAFDNLQSATIRDALLEADLPPDVREILEIRAEAAKASVKKLEAFEARTASDGRARGQFMWYGAHTGRWSGKGIQMQNFPRGLEHKHLVKPFFSLLADMCLSTAELVYPNPLAVLAAALRGFIKAPKGNVFLVVDYAQIELRVLAWIAGEEELLKQLAGGQDPYSTFAGVHMYNRDPATIAKESIERQIAKSALLGAQYQIWIDAFMEYCKVVAGIKISREQATLAITSYREAHPNIVDFWGDIEKAAIHAVETKSDASLNNLRFKYEVHDGRDWLRIYLPSGRPISYYEPRVTMRETTHEKKDRDGNIMYGEDGQPLTYTKKRKVLSFLTEFQGKSIREYTYGGKLTENVVQGCSADIMACGMENAEKAGMPPIMTVHDEVVCEVQDIYASDEDRMGAVHMLEALVCALPPCYDGLPIKAEGFFCYRYRKG